jgi:RNA-directed DNA polymerase
LKSYLKCLNEKLARWATAKYKRFHGKMYRGLYWLGEISRREPNLFYHWQYGVIPPLNPKRRNRKV